MNFHQLKSNWFKKKVKLIITNVKRLLQVAFLLLNTYGNCPCPCKDSCPDVNKYQIEWKAKYPGGPCVHLSQV